MSDQESQTVRRTLGLPTRLLKSIGILTLIVLAVLAAFFVISWQLEEPQTGLQTRVSHVWQRLQGGQGQEQLRALEERLSHLETEYSTTGASLAEIASDLSGMEERLAQVENQPVDPVLVEGDLTLRFLTSLYKAQADLLKTRIEVLDHNWGRAGRELALAIESLDHASPFAKGSQLETIEGLLEDMHALESQIDLGSAVTHDMLELIWHRLGDLTISLAE